MLAKNNWNVCIQFTCPCNWFRLLTNIHVSKASSIAKISQPDHEICSHDFWKSIIFLVRRIIMPNWDDCIIWFRCVHYIAGRPQSITTWRRFFGSWTRNSKFYFSIIKWTKSINENDVWLQNPNHALVTWWQYLLLPCHFHLSSHLWLRPLLLSFHALAFLSS